MNQILIFFMTALMGHAPIQKAQPAAETVNLTINYEVLNTIQGYSYESRVDVYVGGTFIGSSSVKDQQTPNSVTVKVPTGKHAVKAVMLAKYEGEWQERTISNQYSQDFVWEKVVNFKKDMKVKLFFDIDTGVHEKKKPKKKK